MDYKNVKIVKIKGGLGNQLFQYSFALFLKEKFGLKVILDISWFQKQTKRNFDQQQKPLPRLSEFRKKKKKRNQQTSGVHRLSDKT